METAYELVEVSWSLAYDFKSQQSSCCVADSSEIEYGTKKIESESKIEYDCDGIPMGQSMDEVRMRQQIIGNFFKQWKASHDVHQVFNQNLQDYILVRSVSVIEACQHSSKSYKSTKAALMFEKILAMAEKVGTTKPKPGNKNQQNFSDMFILQYQDEEIGSVRLTVGIRKRTAEKIQYGISANKEKGTS